MIGRMQSENINKVLSQKINQPIPHLKKKKLLFSKLKINTLNFAIEGWLIRKDQKVQNSQTCQVEVLRVERSWK